MWEKSYTIIEQGVEPEQIWPIWADLDKRVTWDDDTEWVMANGPFQVGTTFSMKPKDWSKPVLMEIVECTPNVSFTDCTRLLLATLYGCHAVEKTPEGLKLTTTIRITGPLSWFWGKVLGNSIVATLPHQTQMIVNQARQAS